MSDADKARQKLLDSADMLRQVLYNLNCYGAVIGHDSILATQRDGSAYGEVYDGFKILVGVLYPDNGIEGRARQIMDTMFDGDIDNTTVKVAAQEVMDKNAPLSQHSIDEVREDLARYQAYKRSLTDGMLDIAKLIGGTSDSARDRAQAALYLDERIAECRAALTYRGVSETAAESLLISSLSSECSYITDRSTETHLDWQRAIDAAKERAALLNITWKDSFIPDYVRSILGLQENVT